MRGFILLASVGPTTRFARVLVLVERKRVRGPTETKNGESLISQMVTQLTNVNEICFKNNPGYIIYVFVCLFVSLAVHAFGSCVRGPAALSGLSGGSRHVQTAVRIRQRWPDGKK